MPSDSRAKAEILASRAYTLQITPDETTDGEPLWVMENPEVPGCIAQGGSPEEALENLKDARTEYILSLLDDGESVPEPAPQATITGARAHTVSVLGSYVQLGQFGTNLIKQADPEEDDDGENRPYKVARKDLPESAIVEA